MGVFEFDQFGEGTRAIANAIASSKAFSLAGGGDTLAAIEKYGVEEGISYISTGGGAFLEFVEGKRLPAVAALEERAAADKCQKVIIVSKTKHSCVVPRSSPPSGPATDDPAVLADMVRAGLDVARINFSHGGKDEQRRRIVAIRAAAEAVGRPIGILADLSGPKIRIESFEKGKIMLAEGQPFALDIALDPSCRQRARGGLRLQGPRQGREGRRHAAAGRRLHRARSDSR